MNPVYLAIMAVCFIYAGYELLTIVCILFVCKALQPSTDIITVQLPNQQYMMGRNYNDPYSNYGYPNFNNNSNVRMQQMGMQNFKPLPKATKTIQIF